LSKQIGTFLLIVIVLLFCIAPASAAGIPGGDSPAASQYLSSYAVDLVALGNGQMSIGMDINATGYMNIIGVNELYIEQKVNGVWVEYDTVYGIYHSDFYSYNDYSYLGEYIFSGVSGRQYRVTMTAFARNSNGSDTGYAYSTAVTCHNP
jgi:hypothetical protein